MTRLLRIFSLLAGLGCLALVGTIETLDFQADHGIARKREQEPTSKWRLLGYKFARLNYEKRFRLKQGIDAERPLGAEEAARFESYAREAWQVDLPHDRLARAMRTYSLWGFPLGVLASLSLFLHSGKGRWRWAGLSTGAVGIGTFLLTSLRYWPSLGW